MTVRIIGNTLRADWKRERERIEREIMEKIERAVLAAIETMQAATPVWEGTTVRNYVVSVGGSGLHTNSAIGSGRPEDTYQEGFGPLGPESRRPANEAAAMLEARAAFDNIKGLKTVVLANTSPHWDLVDAGLAPRLPARYAGGISALGEQTVRVHLDGVL